MAKSVPMFACPTLIVLISTMLMSESGMASVITPSLKFLIAPPLNLAQQPNSPEKQKAFVQAQQLSQAAKKLFEQGTAASRQQALAKYQAALKIWQQLAVNESPPYVARRFVVTTLNAIGTIHYTDGQSQKALESFQQALAIARELKDPLGEAFALTSIANAYSNLGQKPQALELYKQAVSIFQAQKKPATAAGVLTQIGRIYFSLGQTTNALATYNQALDIQRQQKDTDAQATTLKDLGLVYMSLGEPQKALASLNQALEIQRANKDLSGQADTLTYIASVYTSISENQKALASLNAALALQKAAQANISSTQRPFNLSKQALILSNIASVYKSIGNFSQALQSAKQARSLLQQAGLPYQEAEILNQLSYIYSEQGEVKQALDSLNEALKLQRSIKEPAREAFTLGNIAEIYASFGDYQQALDSYNQALDIQRRIKDRPGEAATLKDIAQVYSDLGDYQLSIATYNQALEIFQQIGDRTQTGQTLNSIGSTYRYAENYQKSLEYYNQALKIWRDQGDKFREVATLTGVVRAYESLKGYPKALAAANQILTLSRQLNSSFSEATAYVFLGRVYLATQDYQKALAATSQGVSGFQKLGFQLAEANALSVQGKVYDGLKQPNKAIATYNQELALRQKLSDRSGIADTYYAIALTERNRGNLNAARSQIEETIKLVEGIRTQVTSQDLRTSYFAKVQNYYEFYIDLLMQLHKQNPLQGYDALALQASERARARSLLELLNEAKADIRQGVDPKLLEKERNLQQKLDAIEKRQIELADDAYNEEIAQALAKENATLLEQYRQLQAEIRTKSPRYAALTQPQPLNVTQIQQQVLDDNTLLLEYALGEERSYLWAVSKNSIKSYELPKRADIEATARKFYDLLNTPDYKLGANEDSKVANQLSQMLLQPVAKELGNKRLLIVSDGALQYLPFSALPSPAASTSPTPLLLEHEIVNLPSASTLAVLRQEVSGRKVAPKAIAVFADPVFSSDDDRIQTKVKQTTQQPVDKRNINSLALAKASRNTDVIFTRLPFTRKEAESILSLVPTGERLQALDFTANRTTATNNQLSQYRIVHFATHGILDSTNPELSGVVLSLFDNNGKPQNGYLRLHDVFNLNLPAELVVLSACETGLGEEIKGEGLVGLTRGFMYAGSPRVVVSLWSVDDRATSELMTKFYKKMLQENLKPAAALRSAQIEMWQNQNYTAPFFWAAFTLQGEWK
ncbi:CHAT domain-containing tetratricopeptide repeat protein [Fischerella sp. JS2]|uniref:CHAT domain-containing tetratricopeptide repeat protein n=1 Tax=Fischerella sp. JS2 TaxID=2597771 RepID=UPI0028F1255A|nr:CHAT domain-containing protein [Fischerella sp. JS2]